MTFVPTASLCQKQPCSTFVLTDTTGVYDAGNNAGGWNAPNPVYTDIASVKLIVHPNETDVQTINLTAPSSTIVGQFDYANITDLSLEDGFHRFRYEVEITGDTTYTYEFTVLLLCKSRNCLDAAWKKYACLNCDCAKKKAEELQRAEAMLIAIKAGALSGKAEEVKGMITTINKICSNDDCNC